MSAALGPVALAAHTIVKQIVDFAMAIFGTFSTVAQSLIATCLGKVGALSDSHDIPRSACNVHLTLDGRIPGVHPCKAPRARTVTKYR
jgi:Na+-driven multidrug efflux pump